MVWNDGTANGTLTIAEKKADPSPATGDSSQAGLWAAIAAVAAIVLVEVYRRKKSTGN